MSRKEVGTSRNMRGMPTNRAKRKRKPDRRILQTRDRLGDALIALILEKPVDQVTVQEVLERAGVGRSTFYLHFRDKDDLLVSELEQALETWSTSLSRKQEKSHRVAPVAEVFAHIAQAKKLYRALVDSGRIDAFFDLAQEYFARGIEQRLKTCMQTGNLAETQLRARSHALAGSLLSLLKWWLEHGTKESAQAMDDLFHNIVWKGMLTQ
jgi:AcrR family transcriptional regulator